jgi:hypothetical protein
MVQRKCPKCNAVFDRKSNYDFHVNRKTDCSSNNQTIEISNNKKYSSENISTNLQELAEISTNLQELAEISTELNNQNIFKFNSTNNSNSPSLYCSYCDKKMSSKYTLLRHVKDYCKVKKQNDEEKEHIFKMLLEKDKQKDMEINELKKQNELFEKQNKIFEKQNKMLMDKIDKLINIKDCSKLSKVTNNTNTQNNTLNNSNNTNSNNNIVMVNFGNEDLSVIDRKEFIERIVKKNNLSGVKIPDEVLKIIHFNPQYPQLSNIYISDINREKCMVYENGEWILSNVDNIPQIMDKVCIYSSEQINSLRTKNPNNKPLNDRLEVIEKYNNMIDEDYIQDLREDDFDRKAEISRCENFKKNTYTTMKKTLYNEGKKIKKITKLK